MTDLGEAIRREIDRRELTLYRIWKDTGIDYSTIHAFYHGRRDVRMITLNRLADYLGLELVPRGKARHAKAKAGRR